MLSNVHFYHRITRKIVVAFGSMFNNMKLVRYNKAGTQEIERVTVPLSYMAKEKFYQRITSDPSLTQEVMITLPRMTFELDSITYDPLRKVSSFQSHFGSNTATQIKNAYSAPYNFGFSLNIFVRNTEDGTQLIEQILPYFNPDYTVTINLASIGDNIDVPIILESVSNEISNAEGAAEELRTITWTLTFTAKAYLYGPITDAKVIRKATANTYDSTYTTSNRQTITVASGSGEFKVGELVYEGKTLQTANATAFVDAWDNVSSRLVVIDRNGVLNLGRKLTGAVSNTAYTMSTFENNENQLVNINVVPSANSANVDTDFGFTETILEYPDFL